MSNRKYLNVGNDFVRPVRSSTLIVPKLVSQAATSSISVPVHSIGEDIIRIDVKRSVSQPVQHKKITDYLYSHSLVAFSLIILAIALLAKQVVISAWPVATIPASLPFHRSTYGLNISIPKTDLNSWLNKFTTQPANINLGSQTVAVNPSIIRNWITVSDSTEAKTAGIHLNTALVQSSLLSLANKYTTQPISQVVATRSDGSTETAVYGQNGMSFANPSLITTQAQQASKNLLNNNGFQINAPLVATPFKTISPSAFDKLILVDVNSKKMYIYQNGQLINTFLVSAGKPTTPTPIGEFHIYEKLPLQNMSGFNPDGTPYFQPNVEWVNYFDGGDAVHGVYWHPLSWFGVYNSSHGCVGVPDNEAEWIYNWAPIGTTVITTPN